MVVLLYARYGYFAEGQAAADWARFFYVSNQLILIGWTYVAYRKKVDPLNFRHALLFNGFLVILWANSWMPWLHEIVAAYGILDGILLFIVITLFFEVFFNLGVKKRNA